MNRPHTIDPSLLKRLTPTSVSIVSNDCWGGVLYSRLGLRFESPFIGLVVEAEDYLDFLIRFLAKEEPKLEFISSEYDFPVALCLGARLKFYHYQSEEEAASCFERRYERMNWNRLRVKADFGKSGHTLKDIERWNELQLPHSLALYSPETKIPDDGVHHGLLVSDWVLDGQEMCFRSSSLFQVSTWLRTGKVLPPEAP